MAKYGKKASQKVERALHEQKRGELESGRSGRRVTSRKQAIAIGLSEAREAGAKVPPPPSRKKGAAKKRARTVTGAAANAKKSALSSRRASGGKKKKTARRK